MAPLYLLEAVRKVFGSRPALDIPRLSVRDGASLSVVGPNGSGKSTLLSILAFLCPPTSGAVHFRGTRVEWTPGHLAALRREVTLLHQDPYLFDETVAANVAFGLRARGIRGAVQRDRIREALEAVGLPGFEGRRAKALSGGEGQRVALARALALRPRVLLLDEPLASVDPESSDLLEGVIRGLADRGTTVILAKHDPSRPPLAGGETVRLAGGALLSDPRPGYDLDFDDTKTEPRRHADL